MKCKVGDLARVVFSIRPENVGRIVKVKEYIGKFAEGEDFQFRGMVCRCLVHDHYWWVEADDLSIMIGLSPQAYIPDTWLEPIRPEKMAEHAKEKIDISA
jgi:hypothetical protein